MTSATSDDSGGDSAESGTTKEIWDVAAREFLAWRGHDPGALDRLVILLTPVLWHIARAHGLDREAAEDVVQSTWHALLRDKDSIRDSQAVFRWLTISARRAAWRHARDSSRENSADSATFELASDAVAGPEPQVVAGSIAAVLWHHVSALSARCRRLLRVIAFEDRPNYAALSAELSMPVGAIGPTRMRCLAKLRALLASDPAWVES